MQKQAFSKHRLSFLQKKKRSFLKRFLMRFINSSDSFILQQLPEFIDRESFDIKAFRKIWLEQGGSQSLDFVRLLFLITNVRALESVTGSFAEVGVYKGYTAKILHMLSPTRKFYLFDTFSGFAEKDFEMEKKKKSSSESFADTSLESVKRYIAPNENVVFCKGYFPATASFVPKEEKFALVHLDADLYNPIYEGLKFFYPKMSPNGLIIVHDYLSGAWPGVKEAVDTFLVDKPESIVCIPDKSGTVVIKRSSF